MTTEKTTELAETIVGLAETPDDIPGLDVRLRRLARLAADRVAAVDYAAVTMRADADHCFVAVSPGDDDLTAETIDWPGFRETAAGMGLGAVSVPLFTGSGATPASLDLYGRDAAAMAPLSAGFCAVLDPELDWPGPDDLRPLDAGGEELIAGFVQALEVRETIRLAVLLIATSDRVEADTAYLKLRLRAAETGRALPEEAGTIVADRLSA